MSDIGDDDDDDSGGIWSFSLQFLLNVISVLLFKNVIFCDV